MAAARRLAARSGGRVTVRQVQRANVRKYRTSADAEAALESLVGLGLGFSFVPISIAALAGVRSSEAGLASGLFNTTQQIGGAVGLAVATTIATTFTNRYVDSHAAVNAGSPAALNYGFEIAFYVLAALAGVGAVLSAVLLESKPTAEDVEVAPGVAELEAAA